MATLSVRLFGTLQIERDDAPVYGLDVRKSQELLCYLLLHRDHLYPRETLAGLLWGDASTAQARKCVRQALWQLQAALGGPTEPARQRVILSTADAIQINQTATLWLDVAELEQTFALVKGRSGEELDAPTAELLRTTTRLYQGDLLEGWYQDWCIYERERLQNMYLALLDKLMAYAEAHHAYDDALASGEQILRYDRAHERTHYRMMRLHFLAGDRAAALRQYQRCAATLEEELAVKPSQRTIELQRQIKADRLDAPEYLSTALSPLTPAILPGQATAKELLAQLKAHWHELAILERRISADIVALELALEQQ
jgi:DNA-binding SARP family transcriptional activator